MGYIISRCGTDWYYFYTVKTQLVSQGFNIPFHFLKTGLAVIHQIHLINSKYKIPDAHHSADSGMPPGLDENALLRVNHNNSKLGKGGSYRHVSGVFLMPRRVCHNKASSGCGKIAVRYINRNSLLPLSHQAIQQERIVNLPTSGANPAVQKQRLFLIRIQQL